MNSEPVADSVSFSDIFDCVSDRSRRQVLVDLHASDGPLRADDCVEPPVRLRHIHLPKLESHGLINWDRQKAAITPGPTFEEISPFIELMQDHAQDLPHAWP